MYNSDIFRTFTRWSNHQYYLTVEYFFVGVRMHAQSCPTLRPHGLQLTRLLCPCDFPGKNTGVGCYVLLQENLPNSGIKPVSVASPAFAGGFFTTSAPWIFLSSHKETPYPKQ